MHLRRRPRLPLLKSRVLSVSDDLGGQAFAKVPRRLLSVPSSRRRGRSADRLVIERDGHRLDVEDLAHLLADRLDDGLEVELSGQCVADLVDDRQLGIPLARLLDGPGASERRRDVLTDEGQQVPVGLREAVARSPGRRRSERLAFGFERYAEPAAFPVVCPPLARSRPFDQRPVLRFVEHAPATRRRRVRGDAPRHCRSRSAPGDSGPGIRVEAVDVVWVVHQLPLLVVEGDVEVLGVHQLADDRVHRRIELGHLVDRAGGVGDAVERVLDLQGALTVGLERLQLSDARLEGGPIRPGVPRFRLSGSGRAGFANRLRHRRPRAWR